MRPPLPETVFSYRKYTGILPLRNLYAQWTIGQGSLPRVVVPYA